MKKIIILVILVFSFISSKAQRVYSPYNVVIVDSTLRNVDTIYIVEHNSPFRVLVQEYQEAYNKKEWRKVSTKYIYIHDKWEWYSVFVEPRPVTYISIYNSNSGLYFSPTTIITPPKEKTDKPQNKKK